MPETEPKRRGGQPGNQNASILRRGLYSVGRHWTQQQLEFLQAARDTRGDRAEGVAQVNDLLMAELFRIAQGADYDPRILKHLSEALFKGAAMEAKLRPDHDQDEADAELDGVLADLRRLRELDATP